MAGHWVLLVVSLASGFLSPIPLLQAPLLFPNIREVWAPSFPGPSAHLVIFLNSFISGTFVWYLVRLVAQDTRSARSLEVWPRRWPAILSLALSCLAMVVFLFLATVLMAVPKSGGESQSIIPIHSAFLLTLPAAAMGGVTIILVASRKLWMKWHRPVLPVIAILAVLILSVLAFGL